MCRSQSVNNACLRRQIFTLKPMSKGNERTVLQFQFPSHHYSVLRYRELFLPGGMTHGTSIRVTAWKNREMNNDSDLCYLVLRYFWPRVNLAVLKVYKLLLLLLFFFFWVLVPRSRLTVSELIYTQTWIHLQPWIDSHSNVNSSLTVNRFTLKREFTLNRELIHTQTWIPSRLTMNQFTLKREFTHNCKLIHAQSWIHTWAHVHLPWKFHNNTQIYKIIIKIKSAVLHWKVFSV